MLFEAGAGEVVGRSSNTSAATQGNRHLLEPPPRGGARRGLAEGRGPRVGARLRSPTVYLFTAYLLVAALATPRETGESTSPRSGRGCSCRSRMRWRPCQPWGGSAAPPSLAAALGVPHGGAVLAGAAIVLALASPAFVPSWLR